MCGGQMRSGMGAVGKDKQETKRPTGKHYRGPCEGALFRHRPWRRKDWERPESYLQTKISRPCLPVVCRGEEEGD